MNFLIKSVESAQTSSEKEYLKVHGINTANQKDQTISVFDNLQTKWELIKEGKIVNIKMEQKGKYWNVTDITPADVLPPAPVKTATETTAPEKEWKIDGQVKPHLTNLSKDEQIEKAVWIKELGECLRSGVVDETNPNFATVNKWYWTEMKRVLVIDSKLVEAVKKAGGTPV
jgi:hypothetical protein